MTYILNFFISLLSAYLLWKCTRYWYKPNIEIGDEVSFMEEYRESLKKTIPIYRLKIKNISRNDAFSIKTIMRIRCNNKYLSIELPFVPVLYGNRKNTTVDDVERELPFCLTQINKDRIFTLQDRNIYEKYENGTLSFEDFNIDGAVVEIVLSASDDIAGIVLNKIVPPTPIKDFIKNIKPGTFARGSMKVVTTGSCETIYGDNYQTNF